MRWPVWRQNRRISTINGHFFYTDKFALPTNGLGIIHHIALLNDALKLEHPEKTAEMRSNSPDTDKSIGDAAFDTMDTLGTMMHGFHLSRVLILRIPTIKSRFPWWGITFTAIQPAQRTLLWR